MLIPSYEVEQVASVFILPGLYGVYFPLVLGALWAGSQDSSRTAIRLRILTICMFILVTGHLALWMRSCSLSIAQLGTFVRNTAVEMDVLSIVTWCVPALAGALSDGILAWRCYVAFGRPRWLKWVLTAVIFSNTSVGLVIVLLGRYDSVSWAATSLIINSVLTGSIIIKLTRLSKRDPMRRSQSLVLAAGRILVEASFVSWLGVAAYFVLTIYLLCRSVTMGFEVQQRVFDALNIVFMALPILFGISQVLVVTRTGLSRFISSADFESKVVALTTDFDAAASF